MRVALVYRSFSMEGSLERDSVLAARALTALGVEVHCYCDPELSDAEIPGVTMHPVRALAHSRTRLGYPAEMLSFAVRATAALRRDRGRYDVVDVRGPAGWEQDVVTVHGVAKAMQKRWPEQAGQGARAARLRAELAPVTHPQVAAARAIERRQFRQGRFSRVIAVTEEVRDDVIRVHRVSPDRAHVVPLPIDLPSFRRNGGPTVRASLGIAPQEHVVLFVGHDFGRKGLAAAIEALAGLDAGAHLVVVGRGERRPYVRVAARAGVERRVHFVGSTSEPHLYFSAADVLVLPTKQDPWGIPVIEAMASGVPVVTTQAAGAARVVREAGAGIVLPCGAASGVREAVAAILRDPARRRGMGERGRAAAASFGLEAHAEAVLAVYGCALAERRVRR